MRCLRLLTLCLLSALLGACNVAPRVNTDFNTDYDFGSARTFAIVEPRVAGTAATAMNDILNSRISNAIASSLAARGFQVVEPANADMLVSFLVTSENKTDIHTYNAGFAYHSCWRCGAFGGTTAVDVDQYQEGTLFIDFIDPASKQLQWRGAITKRLSKTRSTEERKKMVSEVVDAIIASFPPPATP